MNFNDCVGLYLCRSTGTTAHGAKRPLMAREPYATGRVGGYPWTLVAAKEYPISHFTGHRPLSGIVRRFWRESLRTRSQIITLYGDAIPAAR
jgi:hypothetical protein